MRFDLRNNIINHIACAFCLLLTNLCIAQNGIAGKDTAALKIKIMERPLLSDSSEVLNLDDFKDNLVLKKVELETNKRQKIDRYEYYKNDSVSEVSLSGGLLGGFYYTCRLKNTPYVIVKLYYANKNIKRKALYFEGNGSDIPLGNDYSFDVHGKPAKTINHDQGWDFSFEKVMAYAEKRGCKIIKYDTQNEIAKKENTAGRKYWQLFLYTDKITGRQTLEIIKLDGKTGEILSQVEEEGDFMWHADAPPPPPKVKIIVPDKTGKTKEPK